MNDFKQESDIICMFTRLIIMWLSGRELGVLVGSSKRKDDLAIKPGG